MPVDHLTGPPPPPARPDAFTAKDHILWTQRINKELAVNGKANGKFSVRAAITSEDVPMRFKPGHSNPRNMATGSLGFHPKSKDARQLKSDLHALQAPPRGKYPWPETSYQDHGWDQKDFGSFEVSPSGLKTLAGVLPRAGHGWTEEPSNDPLPPYEVKVPSGPKAVRERAPYGFFSLEAQRAAQEKADARRAARAASTSSLAAAASRDMQKTPSAKSSKAREVAPWLDRSASEPDYGKLLQIAASANRSGAKTMDAAMDRSRIFYNRHPKNERWYKPLSNSDVAIFADNYSKCWGVQLYAKGKK